MRTPYTMTLLNVLRTIVVASLTTVMAPAAAAQAPVATGVPTTRLVPISGVLSDGRGQPMSGTAAVTFELFDSQVGGTLLWSETQQVEADERGRYTAYLGAASAVPQTAFSSEQARWLAIRIDGRELPRTMLVAVPYALRAADSESLGGRPASSYVTSRADGRLETGDRLVVAEPAVEGSGIAGQIAKFTSATTVGSSVISETATNRIGFGLTDPTGGGVVDSVFTIRNFDNNTGFGILSETQQRRFAINTVSTGGWTIYDGANGTWNEGLRQSSGNVAIGQGPTFVKLWVQGTNTAAIVGHTGGNAPGVEGLSDNGAGVVGFSNTGAAIVGQSLGTGPAGVFQGGEVGIGTVTPLDLLDVKGDIRVGFGTTGCVKDADATIITGTCSSDLRFKKDITPFGRALEKIASLQPVNFHWRADEYADKHFGTSETYGLIAQDVEKVLPELVTTDDQGYKAVRYGALPMHMLQAIKDLKAENDEAEEERLRRLESVASR